MTPTLPSLVDISTQSTRTQRQRDSRITKHVQENTTHVHAAVRVSAVAVSARAVRVVMPVALLGMSRILRQLAAVLGVSMGASLARSMAMTRMIVASVTIRLGCRGSAARCSARGCVVRVMMLGRSGRPDLVLPRSRRGDRARRVVPTGTGPARATVLGLTSLSADARRAVVRCGWRHGAHEARVGSVVLAVSEFLSRLDQVRSGLSRVSVQRRHRVCPSTSRPLGRDIVILRQSNRALGRAVRMAVTVLFASLAEHNDELSKH